MHAHRFAVVFALGLFASTNVFAQQETAPPPSHNAEFSALVAAPLVPPSAQFPPSHLRPYSVGQLSAPRSGAFHEVSMFAPKKVKQWYGWQSMIGVIGGDLLLTLGVLTALGSTGVSGTLMVLGAGGHVLSGPIVHWSHGHVGKGFGSLGLTVGLPALGFLVGKGVESATQTDNRQVLYSFTFAAIGYFAGPIIDMAALSTEEVPASTVKGSRLLLPSSVAIVPMIDGNNRGLSIVGQF